jgi:hypothetical protein
MAPVTGTTITTPAAPTTGSRIDLIYVKQRYPDIEGDSEIEVNVATVAPARSQVIGKYTVSAGQTNTNLAVNSGSVDYSIPYGANLGVLHRYQDTFTGNYPNALTRKGHGSIYVPTDRRLRFSISTTMYSAGAVGFDNSKFVEYGFLPNLDGTDFTIWATPGLHQAWNTIMFESYVTVSAGDHTVNYGMFRAGGTGTAVGVYGNISGYIREGTVFTVEDAGPVV